MNTSSANLRSLPGHGRSGDAGRGIPDTKSAPGDTHHADTRETTDTADQAAFGEFLRQARERR